MAFPAPDQRRLYRHIAEQIAQTILTGEFPVGSRLPSERDLAERLAVSRPSVREALIALEVEGVVQVRLGAGVMVIALPGHNNTPSTHCLLSLQKAWLGAGPFDVINARAIVESECAALAATLASESHLEQMRQALLDMRRTAASGQEALSADQHFHHAIAQASGNSALLMVVQQLWEQRTGPMYTRLESHFSSTKSWAQALAEHEMLFDAVVSRQPDTARSVMRMHMKNAEIRFASTWKSQE